MSLNFTYKKTTLQNKNPVTLQTPVLDFKMQVDQAVILASFKSDTFGGKQLWCQKEGPSPIVTSDPRMTLWPVNNGWSEAAGVGQKQGPLLVQ